MLRETKGGWRAISKGKLVPAKRVHTFLCKAYGENLGPARVAFRALGTQGAPLHPQPWADGLELSTCV